MRHIFICLAAMLLVACSTTCKVAKNSPINEIQFGNGGGVTGLVTCYTVKADGSLWKEDKQIKTLSRDTLSSIYELVEKLPKENYVHPGNTYSFLRVHIHENVYYYTWSWDSLPDKVAVELFTKLNKQL